MTTTKAGMISTCDTFLEGGPTPFLPKKIEFHDSDMDSESSTASNSNAHLKAAAVSTNDEVKYAPFYAVSFCSPSSSGFLANRARRTRERARSEGD
jgi:hypothetical protein